MGSILKFPLERVQRRSIGLADETHNAEILIFEGVQYEKAKSPKKPLKTNKKAVKK